MIEMIELLKKLCAQHGPTAHEWEIQKMMASLFNEMGVECEGDAIGNLYAMQPGKGGLNLALVAHADEIGLQIHSITDCGLLKFRKIGGLRASSLDGHRVTILSEFGNIPGIIGSDPMNDNGTDTGLLVKTDDLWIDIGAESREQAEQMVSIGDFAVFEAEFSLLGNRRVASKALDDRLGLCVLLSAMDRLRSESLNLNLLAISTVQEEIGMRGIKCCRKPIDLAIIIDVDYATDVPSKHPEMGYLAIGKGVGVNLNADSNPVLLKLLMDVAAEHNIMIQKTVSRNLSGGTDATLLQTQGNIATINVNLPLRYMHTHAEVCDMRDVDSAVELIVEMVKAIDKLSDVDFVPWRNL